MTSLIDVKRLTPASPSLPSSSLTGESSTALELPEDVKDFLTSPYRKDLMIEFSLGSNKLSLYGQPFVMAKYSELIKSSIPNLAGSKPPHPLLTFGVVLERPMSVLWAMMNGYDLKTSINDESWKEHTLKVKGLTAPELLHMYRLANYFGLDKDLSNIIIEETLQTLSQSAIGLTENDKKSLESILGNSDMPYGVFFPILLRLYRLLPMLNLDPKYTAIVRLHMIDQFATNFGGKVEDQKLLAEALNQFFSKPEQIDYKLFLRDINTEDELKNMNRGEIINEALNMIFDAIDKEPEVKKLVNYIPVYLERTLETYAERKFPQGRSLGRLNPEWIGTIDGHTFGLDRGNNTVMLTVEEWGPDEIRFIAQQLSVSLEEFTEPTSGVLLNPIVS